MRKIVLSLFATIFTVTTLAQDKLFYMDSETEEWMKTYSQWVFYNSEKARLLMPKEAAFGVECLPSFSPEWTLTYDSVAHVLVYKEAQKSIWYNTYSAMYKAKKVSDNYYIDIPRKRRPNGYVAPNIKTFTMTISDEQTAKLRTVWKTAVYGAEDRKVFIIDGVTWNYFIDDRMATTHREKNVLVMFTEELRKAVHSGKTNRMDSLISNEFQHVIDGLTLSPPPEVLPQGTVHTLIIWNGTVLKDSLDEFRTIGVDDRAYFYHHQQSIKMTSFHYKEDEKREFAKKYGITAIDRVIEYKTEPDTLCDAYVRQHPELMQTRRHAKGYVLDQDGKPIANALVAIHGKSCMRCGTATDSTGYFSFWVPRTATMLKANCSSDIFGESKIPITDEPIIIRLRRRGSSF